MPKTSERRKLIRTYLIASTVGRRFTVPHNITFADVEEYLHTLHLDLNILLAILRARYLHGRGRPAIAKSGNFHLAWEYAQNPQDHHRFVNRGGQRTDSGRF
jgi:hypothetical protein